MHFNEAYDPFRALRSAFELLRKAPAALLIGGFILWICSDIAPSFAFAFSGDGNFEVDGSRIEDSEALRELVTDVGRDTLMALTGAAIAFAFGLALAAFLMSSLVRIGMARATERALSEGSDEIEDLFQSRGRWTWMVALELLRAVLHVLVALPIVALVALAVIGTLAAGGDGGLAAGLGVLATLLLVPAAAYVLLGWALAPYAVAIEGTGPIEALSRSWSLVRGHRWTLLLYLLVGWLAKLILGALLCCCCPLGFLPTAWVETAGFESYLRLVRHGEPGTWLDRPVDPTGATPAV